MMLASEHKQRSLRVVHHAVQARVLTVVMSLGGAIAYVEIVLK